jgi:hypothetical protein
MEMAAAVTRRMMEMAEAVREAAETVVHWEVRWTMGTDGEGTMVDDDGTGMEVTAEGF